MGERLKFVVFSLLVSIFLTISIILCLQHKHKYKVQLIFCDNRLPITIVVEQYNTPTNEDISTVRMALSDAYGYKNVCQITMLEKID